MKKSVLLLSLIVCATVSAQSTWKVDNAHSKVGFSITHLMISEVEGNFGEFDITATANDEFNEPTFNVEIKTASIDTDNDRRNGHLLSADYFDAETFPSITFTTTSVKSTGEKTFELQGDLTMHGVTKAITLNGKVNGVITDQRSKKLKAGLKLTGSINRLEFKVGEETPTLGDDVELNINLEMAQQ